MRPGKRTSLRCLLELQRNVLSAATKEGVKPRELAQLAGAWVRLEERKRILRNRPLPGSLKPEKPMPRRTPAHLLPFSED
jgi:hypothetical protein